MSRATIAPGAAWAILAACDESSPANPRLPAHRRPLVAADEDPLPLPRARRRAPPARRRVCAGGQPQLELRPLGARAGDVPAPVPPLHGEVGALLVSTRRVHPRRGRVPRAPRRTRPGGDAHRRGTGAQRARDRNVSRGDAAAEGAPEDAARRGAHGRGANRARGGRAARAGGDRRDGRVTEARAGQRPLRRTGAHRRPLRPRPGRGGAARDRAADGADRGPRGVARAMSARPLLAIDGDSLAHRAYHALPKSIRGAGGRPANALVGFANFLLRLWDAEQPRAVLVAWDSLDTPTYRHEA